MAKVSDEDMALMGRLLGRGEAGEKGAARIAALLDEINRLKDRLSGWELQAQTEARLRLDAESKLDSRDAILRDLVRFNRHYLGLSMEHAKEFDEIIARAEEALQEPPK